MATKVKEKTVDTTPKEKVVLSKAFVEKKMAEGMSKPDIRKTYYETLNPNQWTRALKMMGLSSVRSTKCEFVIESEEPEATTNEVEA